MADLWSFYAALSGSISSVTLNSFTKFTEEAGLLNKHQKRKYFDTLFIEVNNLSVTQERAAKAAAGGSPPSSRTPTQKTRRGVFGDTAELNAAAYREAVATAPGDEYDENDNSRGLSRVEFYVCLLRIAIDRYVRSGEIPDVSDALNTLLSVQIAARLGTLLPVADDFRRDHCYTVPLNASLKRYEGSLRSIFDTLSDVSRVREHVSLEVFLAFVRAAGLIAVDVSDREAILCFGWSRMVVHDPQSLKGYASPATELDAPTRFLTILGIQFLHSCVHLFLACHSHGTLT